MRRRRQFLLGLAVAGLLAVVFASASGVTMTADRDVTIGVAANDRAYLAFDYRMSGVRNGTGNLSVTVENRFPGTALEAVDLSVGGRPAGLLWGEQLRPGERISTRLTGIACGSSMLVTVRGDDVEVRFRRPVRCS